MKPIYTIGIGVREVDDLLKQLNDNCIRFLIDVRSSPYSKHKPDFNHEPLKNTMQRKGIRYDHWGEALGGFPTDPNLLTNGRVDYDKLARQPKFVDALKRLIKALEAGHDIAIMCSEGKPEECHRSKCIGEQLDKLEVDVAHIDIDGTTVSQAEVMRRILGDQMVMPGLEAPLGSRRKWDGDVL